MAEKPQIQEVRNPYDLPPVPKDQERTDYWVGTLPSCPQYNIAIGGLMFHRYTNPPVSVDQATGETQRAYGKGSVESLTPSQVASVTSNLKNKIVRFHGNSGRGSVHNTDHKLFTRLPEDQPLAMHVYMVAVTAELMTLRSVARGSYPPSIYELAGGPAPKVPVRKPTPDVAPEIEDLDKPPSERHRPPQLAGKKER